MSEGIRFFVIIPLPTIMVLLAMWWWVRRMNTPREMRWPYRNRRFRRRSERDVQVD